MEIRERPSTCGFSKLPEKSVYLLSFTSPCDICRSSLVSKSFLAAAQSDLLWESFLPPDVAEILSRATHPVDYSTRKELYFRLCQPLLVDEGKLVGRFMSSAQATLQLTCCSMYKASNWKSQQGRRLTCYLRKPCIYPGSLILSIGDGFLFHTPGLISRQSFYLFAALRLSAQ